MTTRVAVWSTGTLGRHAIAGIDLNPELELVSVFVSNPDKDGKDAGQLADLGRDLGVNASTDRDTVLAAKPECIVYCAITEDRFEFTTTKRRSVRSAGWRRRKKRPT